MITGVLHIAGVWWFYLPEAYSDFKHLGGWPTHEDWLTFERLFYFYFGFWCLSALWVIVAFMTAKTAFDEITFIVEDYQDLLESRHGDDGDDLHDE